MSIHVSDFASVQATLVNVEALLEDKGLDVIQLLKFVEQHARTTRHAALEHISRACAMLEASEPECRTGGLAPWQIKRIERHIEKELENAIALQDLADLVDLTPSYFCKAFKRSFDTSPLAYVQARRIARAKDLMLADDRSLAEIALDCGLCDQAHFSRVFRKLSGVSPSQWRKMSITEEA